MGPGFRRDDGSGAAITGKRPCNNDTACARCSSINRTHRASLPHPNPLSSIRLRKISRLPLRADAGSTCQVSITVSINAMPSPPARHSPSGFGRRRRGSMHGASSVSSKLSTSSTRLTRSPMPPLPSAPYAWRMMFVQASSTASTSRSRSAGSMSSLIEQLAQRVARVAQMLGARRHVMLEQNLRIVRARLFDEQQRGVVDELEMFQIRQQRAQPRIGCRRRMACDQLAHAGAAEAPTFGVAHVGRAVGNAYSAPPFNSMSCASNVMPAMMPSGGPPDANSVNAPRR